MSFKDKVKNRELHNIFAFHIEPVRGCTRRCEFCGINSIIEEVKKPHFMSLELAESISWQIARDFKTKVRIDFSMHGEPLQHPHINEIIRIFRKNLPDSQLSLITNGDPIAIKGVDINSLFENGLNHLMVDLYERSEVQEKKLLDAIHSSDESITVYDYFEDSISIWSYNGYKNKSIIMVKDLATTNEKTRSVHTAGGNLNPELYDKYGIDPNTLPMQAMCTKPYTELSINSDGNVSLCCEDWSRKTIVGNANDDKLIDIWTSEIMEAYRYILSEKRRDLIPVCEKCNLKSFRVGLQKPITLFKDLIPKT